MFNIYDILESEGVIPMNKIFDTTKLFKGITNYGQRKDVVFSVLFDWE